MSRVYSLPVSGAATSCYVIQVKNDACARPLRNTEAHSDGEGFDSCFNSVTKHTQNVDYYATPRFQRTRNTFVIVITVIELFSYLD